jgi:hypothetical protein
LAGQCQHLVGGGQDLGETVDQAVVDLAAVAAAGDQAAVHRHARCADTLGCPATPRPLAATMSLTRGPLVSCSRIAPTTSTADSPVSAEAMQAPLRPQSFCDGFLHSSSLRAQHVNAVGWLAPL